jgi:hypothetical protein
MIMIRKGLLTFILGMITLIAAAQGTMIFTENFETTTLPDSVTHFGTGVHGKSNHLFSGGAMSDSLRIANPGDSVQMRTFAFSTIGYPYVKIAFDQICKIEFFDEAYIEVSANNGTTWTRLTSNEYLGSGNFGGYGNKFTSASYLNEWMPGVYAIPDNSWWKSEQFDISALVGNHVSVMVRFVLRDANNSGQHFDNYAWFIDEIKVTGYLFDYLNPVITMVQPVLQDTITTAAPYVIRAVIQDASGIDTAYIAYKVNSYLTDTIGMIRLAADTFQAVIPFHGWGRTIWYQIVAIDSSNYHNIATEPAAGFRKIHAHYSTLFSYVIGSGSLASQSYGPIYRNDASGSFNWSLYAYLFRAAELTAAGVPANSIIRKIEWYKVNTNYTNGNALFRIFLKNSSSTLWPAVTGTLPWDTITQNASMVYQSTTQQIDDRTGWYPFEVQPYQYTGQDLEIATQWDISMVTNPKASGQITWQYESGLPETRTMGNGATSAPSVVANFFYGGALRPNVRLTVETPYNLSNDAGITEILSPIASVPAAMATPVVVSLKNYGVNNLTGASIQWSIDDVLQTPFQYTGSIAQDSVLSPVNLGSVTLTHGIHRIKVWTENPNGFTDANLANDTAYMTFMVCSGPLIGNYSIGTSSTDFGSIGDALMALQQCGISGPVTMNIAPGFYQEQLIFPAVAGVNQLNTITFQSLNNDSSSVIIGFEAIHQGENYVALFDNSRYFILRHLTFKALDKFYARALLFVNHNSSITFQNCALIGASFNLFDDEQSLFVANGGGIDSAITIQHTRFTDGFNAIVLSGYSVDTLINNVQINNNFFLNQFLLAANLNALNAPVFSHNIIRTTKPSLPSQGVNLFRLKNQWKFTHNTIDLLSGPRALSIAYCNSSFGQEALFANNLISQGGIHSSNMIDFNNGTNIRFYHNNFHKYAITTGNTFNINTTPVTHQTDSLYFYNNIFANSDVNGRLVNFPVALGNRRILFDHNNYFTNSASFGANATVVYPSLPAWKTGLNLDGNSLNVNPQFVANNNLHIINYALKGQGIQNSYVLDDIDGKPRTTLPTIGAHELFELTDDLLVSELLQPISGCGLTSSEQVQIRIINNGQNAIYTPFSLSFAKEGGTPVTEIVSLMLNPGDTLNYTFSGTVNLDLGYYPSDSLFNLKVWATYAPDQFVFNDTLATSVISGYQPDIPTATSYTVNYGSPATITANSNDTLYWFANYYDTTPLFTGKYFTTPPQFDTTAWYVSAASLNGLQCMSNKASVIVDVTNYPQFDASVSAINQPVNSVVSNTPEILQVTLHNHGLQTLTSAKLSYSINGILTDSIAWTGSLPKGSSMLVNIDTLILAPGFYTLQVWSSMPNGNTDGWSGNDTSTITLRSCMQGVYTIGQSGGSQTYDFNTVNSAVSTLLAGGVCGDVIFRIAAGTYNEKVLITTIPGAGPSAGVTFTSMNGDSTSAKIAWALTGTDSSVVTLNGASYLTFSKLWISSLGSTGSHGRAFMMKNGSHNNTLENCFLEGVATTITGNNLVVVYSMNEVAHNATIRNNRIINGTSGIYLHAGTTILGKGNVLADNVISHFTFAGIVSGYQDSIQIINNRITKVITSGAFNGISVNQLTNGSNISSNWIDVTGPAYSTPLQLQNFNGSANARNLVSNNFLIGVAGSTISNGINVTSSNNSDIFYNSINMVGNGAFGRGVTFNNSTDLRFVNNIVNVPAAQVLYFTNTNTFLVSDYNCYYTAGGTFAFQNISLVSFNDYKAATGRDANSVVTLPPYASATDLHLTNTSLSGKAIVLPEVTTDIDNQTRSSFPTIGADEYPLAPKDAGILSIINPTANTNENDTLTPLIVIRNMGTDTMVALPISYSINAGNPVNFTWIGALPMFGTDTVALPPFTCPAGQYSFCVNAHLPGDTNLLNDQFCLSLYGFPAHDASLDRIIPMQQGCSLSQDTVKIVIANHGVAAINGNLTAYYQVNNTLPLVSQVVSGTIIPGDSVLFAFNTPVNLATTGNDTVFNIRSWVSLANDNVNYNDTAVYSVISLLNPAAPVAASVSVNYGSSATCQVTVPNNSVAQWYHQPAGGALLSQHTVYITPTLYQSDTLWVESKREPVELDTATIGNGSIVNGSTSYPTPYGNQYQGSKEQYLITAGELLAMGGKAGLITSLAFHVDSVNNCPQLYGYQIRMTQTNVTAMTGWIPGQLTSVFSVPTYQPFKGWNIHQFQQPFEWDGLSNVVVEVCFNNASSASNGNASVFSSPTPMYTVSHYAGNYSYVCTTPGNYNLSANRPNMKLNFAMEGCSSQRVPLYIAVGAIPTTDLGVTRIIKPVTSVILGAQDTVRVVIRNFGSQAQANIPVRLQINNLPVIAETIASTIQSGDSIIYTFNTLCDFSTPGAQFHLQVYTTMPGDTFNVNDTISAMITHQLTGYCISEAMDAAMTDIINVTAHTMVNSSPASGKKYTNFSAITPAPALTPGVTYPISISTGMPQGSATPVGAYVKVWIDFNQDKVFDANEMVFGAATSTNATVQGTFTIPGNALQGNTLMRVVMVRYGTVNSVQPCGSYQYGETEDYLVQITDLLACDAGVTAFIQPDYAYPQNSSVPVWVKIFNFGTDTIFPGNLSVAYRFNNGNPVVVPYNHTLLPLQADSVQLPSITIPLGDNTLCSYTILGCDSNPGNDETCTNVFGYSTVNIPYSDNFDGANLWYTDNSNNWQRGIPGGTTINAPSSPPNAWMTVLNNYHPVNTNDHLYSPIINLSGLSLIDTVTLKFWHAMHTEQGTGGGILQYSLNNGATWASIGFIADPSTQNWYNTNISGQHCWSGNISWTQAAIKLEPGVFNQGSQVQFRFRFFSNASSNNFDGWAIDNFEVGLPQIPDDVGVIGMINPAGSTPAASFNSVTVILKNYGTATQTSFPVNYKINSEPPVSQTWNGFLAPGDTTSFTFSTGFISPVAGYLFCAYTALNGDAYSFNDSLYVAISTTPGPVDLVAGSSFPVDTTCFNTAINPILCIRNEGTDPASSFSVIYQVDNSAPVSQAWSGLLLPGDSVCIQFAQAYVSPSGAYNFKIWVEVTGDLDTSNNHLTRVLTGVVCNPGFEEFSYSGLRVAQNIPNPSSDRTFIEFFLPEYGEYRFSIINMLGQTMYSEQSNAPAGNHLLSLDVSLLESGIYLYAIEFKGVRVVKRMMIVR